MFSDHSKPADKPGKAQSRAVIATVCGLTFVALLAALVQVASGQVEQAQRRQAQHQEAQRALTACSYNHSGLAHRQCIAQVNATLTPYSTYTPGTEVQASTQRPALAAPSPAHAPVAAGGPGVVQAAFVSE